ncbi:MAG: AAA family ATPase [Methylomicrobium sp.]|nr:AAA family ATPase [Methylomicrobium sp.]
MAENEVLTAKAGQSVTASSKQATQSLITTERSQKLDLLIHLISNLVQPIIVCGPHGIGKTTLLNRLVEKITADCLCCYVKSANHLTFESIQNQLTEFLGQNTVKTESLSLPTLIQRLEKQHQKLVLILDEAGGLEPGLINRLAHYAEDNAALRIVFALTQDELYVKNTTDNAVEDCHFVELPPLSEKQCMEFLQNLSGKPGAALPFQAITETMVADLYRETHGIPGLIVAEWPHVSNYKKRRVKHRRSSLLFAVLLIAAALIYFAWQETELEELSSISLPFTEQTDDTSKLDQATVPIETTALPEPLHSQDEQEFAEADISSRYLDQDQVNSEEETAPPEDQTTEFVPENTEVVQAKQPEPIVLKEPQAEPPKITEPVKPKPVKSPTPDAEQKNEPLPYKLVSPADQKSGPVNDHKSWVQAQQASGHTVQVMVLSSLQAAQEVVKKYNKLPQPLRYIRTTIGGKEKFIVVYGSFTSAAAAEKAIQTLPKELRQSWVRSFNGLQSETRKEP